MEKTKTMKEREQRIGGEWNDEGEGYFSLIGYSGMGMVTYIALPKGHPGIDKDYDELEPDVNGGLTYGHENVFGWDYSHAYNSGSPQKHIKNALKYFKERLKKEAQKK